MSPSENLYYAIGELAFCIARSDGEVQSDERKKLHEIFARHLDSYQSGVSEIIFKLLDKKEHYDSETTYNWAMREIRMNSHYLSPALKQSFMLILEEVASAFPPVTAEESRYISRFKKDIEPLQGDPVYYNS